MKQYSHRHRARQCCVQSGPRPCFLGNPLLGRWGKLCPETPYLKLTLGGMEEAASL